LPAAMACCPAGHRYRAPRARSADRCRCTRSVKPLLKWQRGAVRTTRLVIVLVLAVVGCGSDGLLLDEDSLPPTGAPLGEDFVVPDGARLVGTRFPGFGESWDALLLIEDDPVVVVEDLLGQSEKAGLVARSGRFDGTCVIERVLQCDLYVLSGDSLVLYEFGVRWGWDNGTSFRHVLVRVQPNNVGELLDHSPAAEDLSGIQLPRAPLAVDEWRPPSVGEPLAGPTDAFPERVADRQPGSTMVAPPGPAWCVTGGYVAVLRVDGDMERVVADYAAEFEDFGFDGDTAEEEFEGQTVLAARHSAAGGGELEAIAIDDGDGRTLLRISRCND
jgi:hypothetical protein